MGKKKFSLEVSLEALDKITAPVQRMQRRLDALYAPLRKVSGALGAISANAGLPKVGAALKGVGKGLRTIGSEFWAFGKTVTLGVGVAGAAIFGLVKSFASAGEEAYESAARLGVGIETLQELRFAANRAGVETGEFDAALGALSKNMGAARAGAGPLASMLGKISPTLLEDVLRAKDAGEAFEVLVDRLSQVPDPTLRAAAAQAAFGRAGRKMLTVISEGPEELARMRERARELGVVIGGDAARAADAFGDSLSDLKNSALGARNIIGAQLLPILHPLIDRLTNMVVVLGPRIQAWARDFAAKLPGRLRELRDGAVEVYDKLKPLIALGKTLVDQFGAVNVAMALVALTIGRDLSVAVVQFVPLVWKLIAALAPLAGAGIVAGGGSLLIALASGLGYVAGAFYVLGAAILTTPVGWVLLAIAAIVGAVWWLSKNWDSAMSAISDAWTFYTWPIRETVKWLLDAFPKLAGMIPNWALRLIGIDTGRSADARTSQAPTGSAADRDGAPTGDIGAAVNAGAARRSGDARVRVDFSNLPRGATVRTEENRGGNLKTNVGYALEGF